MRDNTIGALWRLTIFVVVCSIVMFGLFAVFGQLRFQPELAYNAEFTNISGLKAGNFVRIAGVEVGQVKHISIRRDNIVVVRFSIDDAVVLTGGSKALIRYDNVIGDRYMELQDGPGGTARLTGGQTIPVDRTAPALDLDALIGGFRPLFRALDPLQVNALTGQLIAAFQGQGAAVSSFLAQTAAVTDTLADREAVIGQVIVNLNKVLGSLGKQSGQVDKTVASLAELTRTPGRAQKRHHQRGRVRRCRCAHRGRPPEAGPAAVCEHRLPIRSHQQHRVGRPRLRRRSAQHAA